MERGSSAVECRTRNQVSPGSNPPLLPFRRFGHFRSLHWRPSWLSCIIEYLAIGSGGNVSDLVFVRNCCMTRMLPGDAELVSEWTGLPGRAKVYSALSDPTDWILHCIKTTFTFTMNWMMFIIMWTKSFSVWPAAMNSVVAIPGYFKAKL